MNIFNKLNAIAAAVHVISMVPRPVESPFYGNAGNAQNGMYFATKGNAARAKRKSKLSRNIRLHKKISTQHLPKYRKSLPTNIL